MLKRWLLLLGSSLILWGCAADSSSDLKFKLVSPEGKLCDQTPMLLNITSSGFHSPVWFLDGQEVEDCRDQFLCKASFEDAGERVVELQAIEGQSDEKKSVRQTFTIEEKLFGIMGSYTLSATTIDGMPKYIYSYTSDNSLEYTTSNNEEGMLSGSATIGPSNIRPDSCDTARIKVNYVGRLIKNRYDQDIDNEDNDVTWEANYELRVSTDDPSQLEFTSVSGGSSGCSADHDYKVDGNFLTLPFFKNSIFSLSCESIGTGVWRK